MRQYLEGEGGPPLMTGDGSQALFLRETQQWINSEDQVSPTRPSASFAQVNLSNFKPNHCALNSALVADSKAVTTLRHRVYTICQFIHSFIKCMSFLLRVRAYSPA